MTASPGKGDAAAYQGRVLAEKKELERKLGALDGFADSGTFAALPARERTLLLRQRRVMALYTRILEERIARFSAP